MERRFIFAQRVIPAFLRLERGGALPGGVKSVRARGRIQPRHALGSFRSVRTKVARFLERSAGFVKPACTQCGNA